MEKPVITVIGSINMDLVTMTDVFPKQGETVRGSAFQTIPGGKGANQAVAAVRLGAEVHMIGLVGDDSFGTQLLTNLNKEGINTSCIKVISDCPSGLANIILSEQDNRIIIHPGANQHVTPDYVEMYKETILRSDYVLLQFEIPRVTIEHCLQLCAAHQIPVIVNPAPAMALTKEAYEQAAFITPNETEAKQLFQESSNEKLIVTKGHKGVSYFEHGESRHIPAHDIKVVDTTGAGDTFNGALAVALAEGSSLTEAIQFANAAAALSVQKNGAQNGMPNLDEVRDFMQKG